MCCVLHSYVLHVCVAIYRVLFVYPQSLGPYAQLGIGPAPPTMDFPQQRQLGMRQWDQCSHDADEGVKARNNSSQEAQGREEEEAKCQIACQGVRE